LPCNTQHLYFNIDINHGVFPIPRRSLLRLPSLASVSKILPRLALGIIVANTS
jgi:hypothetical protein